MDTATQVRPANVTKTNDRAALAKDQKLVDRLVSLWRANAERDLGTRYQTGRLLNERLGSPTERQSHGQRVLKAAAERLGIAESDLNRMRWYSHLVDATALRQDHPEIDSWTRFKEGLTDLKAEYGFEARKPAESPSRPALRGVVRSCTNLASMLDGLDFQPGDAERKHFLDALQKVAEAASRRLKISVVVAVE
jgi:hypothetical protein